MALVLEVAVRHERLVKFNSKFVNQIVAQYHHYLGNIIIFRSEGDQAKPG